MSHTYYADKSSGTSADTLLALGFARMLQTMLNQFGRGSEPMRSGYAMKGDC